MSKLKMMSPDLTAQNIDKIAELFPMCVTEVQDAEGNMTRAIDFDLLKQELSSSLVEGPVERYQLDWPGKRESLLAANAPIAKTLRPAPEESVEFDTTENLFIEGDNLEALKLLQESYLGKVKMIYIDPPYNTGNDFVYNDDFAESSDEYLERSMQKDEEGNRLVANTESNGRFHSDWLSMMHSRLRLARNLLTDDGVIFISIDDNEQANLKRLCDEVFGEQNFVANMVRQNKVGGGHDARKLAIEYDYILCYTKYYDEENIYKLVQNVEDDSKYKYEDEHISKRGRYYLRDLDYSGSYSESLDYEIKCPDGSTVYPGGKQGRPNTWRWSNEKVEWGIKNDFIVFKKRENSWKIYIKQYQYVDNNNDPYIRTIPYRAFVTALNSQGTSELRNLFKERIFSFPKSTSLISELLGISTRLNKNDIILDFFAGSSTTAHAVMQLNAEDGGNRKFIMVQLPEATDEKSEAYKAGYKTIAEISKERIRRAGKQILESDEIHEDWNRDVGFRVFKVDSSNMKDVYYQPESLTQADLLEQVDNIKEDRTPEDLLFQVMLDWGLELSLPIKTEEIEGKKVFSVADDALIACFDTGITESLVKTLAERAPLRILFCDNHYLDNDTKINAEQLVKQVAPNTELKSI